ncbi:hypothetical protein [Brucella gallinifaecis]|uniref:hypothetical protein n=1 Tax=Brucella gallinifaecis TaxID=215590 RepID=UPI00235DEC06|nr:hypothetical protein [Brucella gallinifaecis]
MAIIIPNKNKGVSNKTETLPEKPESNSHQLMPFIDKISIVVKPDKERGHAMYQELITDLDQKDYFLDGPKPKGEYQFSKRIVLQTATKLKHYPLIQVRYLKEQKLIERFRLEFVPVDLGTEGMEELHMVLGGLIEDGWDYVRKHGKVTRIDVTIDIPQIPMESFLLLSSQGISSRTWSMSGSLQTIIFGKKTGNQTIVYDRGAKRKAQKQSAEGKQGVRVERRLSKLPSLKVAELKKLENPFAKLTLLEKLPSNPPSSATSPSQIGQWQMFCDSVQIRQLSNALTLLSEEKRAVFRKHIKNHAAPWWDAEAIWSNWDHVLEDMKFIGKLPGN